MQVNDRVGAILSANATSVQILGFGTYLGDLIRDDAEKLWQKLWKKQGEFIQKEEGLTEEEAKAIFMTNPLITNPCIRLDNGDIVWGYQCWFGPEEKIRETIGNRTVEEIRIADLIKKNEASPQIQEYGLFKEFIRENFTL